MPGFTLTETVNAPITTVFHVFSDVEHAASRIPAIVRIEMLTSGPLGVGSRFKETRVMFKREHSETFTFSVYEPESRYELVSDSCGVQVRTEFRFRADGDRTHVELTLMTVANSFWAKLFAPLAKLMMGTMKKCVADDLAALRTACELPPPAVAA